MSLNCVRRHYIFLEFYDFLENSDFFCFFQVSSLLGLDSLNLRSFFIKNGCSIKVLKSSYAKLQLPFIFPWFVFSSNIVFVIQCSDFFKFVKIINELQSLFISFNVYNKVICCYFLFSNYFFYPSFWMNYKSLGNATLNAFLVVISHFFLSFFLVSFSTLFLVLLSCFFFKRKPHANIKSIN